jgi:hypothetical protein
MGLNDCLNYEFDLSNEESDDSVQFFPRNQCRDYVKRRGGKARLVLKITFDSFCRSKCFFDGPYTERFGDGYGKPYNPNRQAFGTLNSGEVVYCEMSQENQGELEEFLKLMPKKVD